MSLVTVNAFEINNFINVFTGEVGDWKNYLNPDMIQVMDTWIDEHLKEISF